MFMIIVYETGGSLEPHSRWYSNHKTRQWQEASLSYYFESYAKFNKV
jgi:hypothetical protein